jgi:hypothetical protein
MDTRWEVHVDIHTFSVKQKLKHDIDAEEPVPHDRA